MTQIPPSIIGAAAHVLEGWYTHAQLNALFDSNSFPGDEPVGTNKLEKCRQWLRRGNTELPDPLASFGQLIAEMMDSEMAPPYRAAWDTSPLEEVPDPRNRIINALAKEGLSYSRGGYIHGANLVGPSKSLRERLKTNGMQTVETEFKRAYDSIESDPPQAVTAACSILEALCKNYLDIEEEEGPNKQVLGNLFPQVMTHLGLSPKDLVDDDLKQILTGQYSIATGVAALRTHAGSAHGRSDKKYYKIEPRHARLAVHSAHTITMFILETWEARKAGR